MITIDDALRDAANEELSRRRLVDFALRMDKNYVDAAHVKYLCRVLESLERGEIRNLIVLIPPRHGKTRLVSEFFPSWWMGRHPSDEMILSSNTSGLAEDNSAKVRNLLMADDYPFETRVSPDTFAKDLWRTTDGGVVRAAGVGSSIQGRGGNVLICDDPIAGVEEATESAFERQWRWFTQDFFPRRLSDSHVIVSMFRWGDLDLAGRILAHDDPTFVSDWTVVHLPAYAREGDVLGREPGDVLWPPNVTANGRRVGYDKAFLETQRKADSRVWAAQYELDPVPAGGLLFKPEWFEHRYDVVPGEARFKFQAADSAWKEGLSNDRTAIVTLATDTKDIYVLDLWYGRVAYTDLRRVAIENFQKHVPRLLYVEEAASGFALVDSLRRTTGIPVKGIPPGRDSKEARAEAVTNWFEAGRIKFPRNATWMQELLTEFLRFPHGRHDDIVDALVLGVSQVREFIQQAIVRPEQLARMRARWRIAHT